MAETSVVGGVQRFTDRLWAQTEQLRTAIDELEFLHRLGDGTLPLAVFRSYIEQDSLYLAGYSKALALLAARSPDPVTGGFWAGAASTAATVELSLHHNLLSSGVLPETGVEPTHSSACLGYVSYLIAAAATEPYPIAAAAALPCFWIYAEVGRDLAVRAKDVLAADPQHPYAQWVTTYDNADFRDEVERARELVDRAGEAATDAEREGMATAFTIATRYELMFWDTALHPQPWPVSE